MIELSILVCTIESRAHFLRRLLDVLEPQLNDFVELKVASDAGEISIGRKRNQLVKQAKGKWICFIDDDDWVVPDYVASIRKALTTDPDCVGFRAQRHVDGRFDGEAYHTLRNAGYATKQVDGETIYIRTPNHLNPIRADIVRRVKFPEINHGEDTNFAQRIKSLLTTEAYIDRALYVYDYRTEAHRSDEVTNRKATRR